MELSIVLKACIDLHIAEQIVNLSLSNIAHTLIEPDWHRWNALWMLIMKHGFINRNNARGGSSTRDPGNAPCVA